MSLVQKPLPDSYNVHAWGMGDLILMLRDQIGIPLRELIDLSPQQLYDLTSQFADDGDAQRIDHLVVIDDATGDALKELNRRTVDRFRPENRGVAHNVSIEARSIALRKTALEADAAVSLTELEKRLWDVTGEPAVVLEDDDFAAYGVEMNSIISARPHGRSHVLDDTQAEPASGHQHRGPGRTAATTKPGAACGARLDETREGVPPSSGQTVRRSDGTIMSFLIATRILTRFGHDTLSEDRDVEPTVMFMAGPANNAMARRDTAALARRTGKCVVYLEFERGKAARGPRNIVVFEIKDGELTTWDRCALWSRVDNPLTVILPRGHDFAFGNDGVGIRRMTGAPTQNLASGFATAKAELLAAAGRMTPEMFDEIEMVKNQVFHGGDR